MVYKKVTRGFKVCVTPTFIAEESNPSKGQYVHEYKICITNQTEYPAQLLRRMWVITSGDGTERLVTGAGVVGEQPIIEPGASHTYSSWTPTEFPLGKMHGKFQMIRLDNDALFNIEVPQFQLTASFIKN